MTDPATTPAPPTPSGTPAPLEGLERYVPLLAWVFVLAAVLLIPGKVVSYGYLPTDDGLRHAAHAIDGRSWSDTLVLREPFAVDPEYGWELIQRQLYLRLGAGAEALVEISVAALFILVCVAGMAWFRRPEAWLGALILSDYIGDPAIRFFFGRPYLVTYTAVAIMLLAWRRFGGQAPRCRDVAWMTGAIAVACFVHGTWYLWAVPVAAFFLARQFRWAVALAVSAGLGAVLAGLATGHPIAYLTDALSLALRCMGSYRTQSLMANELQPAINFNALLVVGVMALARRLIAAPWQPMGRDPAFWLAFLGWVLGCSTGRFWYDWGTAGLLVMVAWDIQTLLELAAPWNSWKRLGSAAAVTLMAYACLTSDTGSRWTGAQHNQYLEASDPELAGWMPEAGGIIYSSSMSVFYRTYFKNPTAPWKYMVGFEPTLLPDDDFKIYYKIRWNYDEAAGYEPWVKQMRASDRLVLMASGRPPLPQLEWKHAIGDYWIGRVPVTNAPTTNMPVTNAPVMNGTTTNAPAIESKTIEPKAIAPK